MSLRFARATWMVCALAQESGEESDGKDASTLSLPPPGRPVGNGWQRGARAHGEDGHTGRFRAERPERTRRLPSRADGRDNPRVRYNSTAERDRWPAHHDRTRERAPKTQPAASVEQSARSGSRDRAKSREASLTNEEAGRRGLAHQPRPVPCEAQLRGLQEQITIDTVCVSAAKACAAATSSTCYTIAGRS
jgi:hypothetical protein